MRVDRDFTAISRVSLYALAGSMMVAGCQSEVPLEVSIVSSSNIIFTIPKGYRDNFCLNSAELRPAADRERPVALWKAQLVPEDGKPCPYEVRFPRPGGGFLVKSSLDDLPPGDYDINIDGGLKSASAHFSINR